MSRLPTRAILGGDDTGADCSVQPLLIGQQTLPWSEVSIYLDTPTM